MASPSLVSFRIVGANGAKKSMVIPVSSANTQTEIEAFVAEIDQLLDNCIDGYIDLVTVTKSVAFSVTGTSALADRHVDDGGLLSFSATGIDLKYGIYVPTYALSLITDTSKDIANSGATATLTSALLGGANADVVDRNDHALASFLKGTRVTRK